MRTAALLLLVPALASQCDQGPAPATLDVRSLGAVCDGNTDDAAVLQAALDIVPDGGTVVIPCMLGVGASGVVLADRSDVTIVGDGRNGGIRSLAVTSQRADRFGPVLFLLQRCEGCSVRDLAFEGQGLDVAPLGLLACSRTTIENNRISNVGSVGGGALVSSGGVLNRYLGNTILGTAGAPPGKPYGQGATRGMWLGNVYPGSEERHPLIERNRLSDLGHTGIATHMVGGIVRLNIVEDTGGAGLKLVPPPDIVEGRTLVEENIFRRNAFCGLQIQDAHHVTVRKNRLEANDHPGIYVSGPFSDSVLESNLILDNDRADDDRRDGGIIVHQATNVIIRDNEIRDTRSGESRTQTFGLRLLSREGPLRNLEVYGNRCDNHLFDGIVIEVEGEIDGLTISSNRCTGNSRFGLAVKNHEAGETHGVKVCGNDLTGNRRGELDNGDSPDLENTDCP